LYCIVFLNFYSASHSQSLSEALPTTAIDTVSELRANVGAYLTGVSCLPSIVGEHLSARYNCRRAFFVCAKDGVPNIS